MDETMNTGVEVTTEETGVGKEIVIEDFSSGPSKGFVTLIAGGIVAVVIGTAIAIKRHKKKKAEAREEEAFDDQVFVNEEDDYVDDDVDGENKSKE